MQPEIRDEPQCGGYGPGHPWFYVLGGKVLPPKRIMENAKRRAYRGYLADEIDRINWLAELKRSQRLRAMQAKALVEYRSDLSRYRELALNLYRYRRKPCRDDATRCDGVHIAISLTHNHLFNDLAHLVVLEPDVAAR